MAAPAGAAAAGGEAEDDAAGRVQYALGRHDSQQLLNPSGSVDASGDGAGQRRRPHLEPLETELGSPRLYDFDEVHVAGGPCRWCSAVLGDVVAAPRNVARYYSRLSAAFSWRFVAMVSIVYGLNQGVGEALYMFATRYLFSDPPPKGFGLQADRIQSIDGFSNVPWQIKSVYGIASDTFPIQGYHRTPYVILAGALGLAAWSGLWLLPLLTVGLAGTLLFLGNLSVASPDVMIDAAVAERCKTHPHLASDLQTLCWASYGLGKILSSLTMGSLYEVSFIGARGLFGITLFTAVGMLVPAVAGWLCEEPIRDGFVAAAGGIGEESTRIVGADGENGDGAAERATFLGSEQGCTTRLKEAFQDSVSGPVYRLAFVVLVISLSVGFVAKLSKNDGLIFFVAVLAACAMSFAVYWFERNISVRLAKASIYIFLSQAVQPSSSLMYLWMKHDPDYCDVNAANCEGTYCPRPCFEPHFLSSVEVVAYVAFVVGTSLYNKYLADWPYRRIWASTQILLAMSCILDLIFVWRWNLTFGIPDRVFVIGDEVLSDLIQRLNSMPLYLLAAATCPDGVEATLFAMNMGLSNFGATLGEYNGVGMIWILGGIESPDFNNLGMFLVLRAGGKLLPLLLIPLLVPDGSPRSENMSQHSEDKVTGEAFGGTGQESALARS